MIGAFSDSVISKSRLRPAGYILIACIGLTAYGPSLSGKYIRDDFDLVKNNEYIRSWTNLPKFFTRDIAHGAGRHHGFYRPLQMISYCFDYTFWKYNSFGYHLTNTLLHICAAVLVVRLLLLMQFPPLAAFLSGLLFTVIPVQTEAVMYISGRNDSLSLIFMLLTFMFYLKSAGIPACKKYYAGAFCCFACALLSKENSVVIPALILAYHFGFHRKVHFRVFIPLVAAVVFFLAVRLTFLRDRNIDPAWAFSSVIQRIPGFFVALTYYVQLLLWPYPLYFRFGMQYFPIFHIRALAGIILCVGCAYAVWRLRGENSYLRFSMIFFFAALIPVSGLYPSTYFMTEHWLYVPSIGFLSAIGLLAHRISRILAPHVPEKPILKIARPAAHVFPALLTLVYAAIVVRQSSFWRDTESFYNRTIAFQPAYAEHFFRLGEYYKDAGDIRKAVASYSKAMALAPGDVETIGNLANAYRESGRLDSAIYLYRKALSIRSDDPIAYVNLGNAYNDSGNPDMALEAYRNAVRLAPSCTIGHFNIGILLIGRKDFAGAVAALGKAVELNPRDAEALFDMAYCHLMLGDLASALSYCNRSSQLGRDTRSLEAAIHAAAALITH